jgi:hypothetical protein
MSADVTDSILDFVQTRRYPESETAISAELQPSTFNTVLAAVEKARVELKVRRYIFIHYL